MWPMSEPIVGAVQQDPHWRSSVFQLRENDRGVRSQKRPRGVIMLGKVITSAIGQKAKNRFINTHWDLQLFRTWLARV